MKTDDAGKARWNGNEKCICHHALDCHDGAGECRHQDCECPRFFENCEDNFDYLTQAIDEETPCQMPN